MSEPTPHLPAKQSLEALLDKVFPAIEPSKKRVPPMRGDDSAVDDRDDERSAISEFIDRAVIEGYGLPEQQAAQIKALRAALKVAREHFVAIYGSGPISIEEDTGYSRGVDPQVDGWARRATRNIDKALSLNPEGAQIEKPIASTLNK